MARRKPIYVPTEDSLSPKKIRSLVKNGWTYKPANKGVGVPGGGHWVPPGYIVVPGTNKSDTHGKHYARVALEKRAKTYNV